MIIELVATGNYLRRCCRTVADTVDFGATGGSPAGDGALLPRRGEALTEGKSTLAEDPLWYFCIRWYWPEAMGVGG